MLRTMPLKTFLKASLISVALAACGSASEERFDIVGAATLFNQVQVTATAEGFTMATEMPTTGRATYTGFVRAQPNLSGTSITVGNAVFQADFGAAAITMTSSGFEDFEITGTGGTDFQSRGAVSGNLTISNGVISNNGLQLGSFDGTVTGTVAGTSYSVPVEALFVGDTAQQILGSGTDGQKFVEFAAGQ